jgi:hypothetical protein
MVPVVRGGLVSIAEVHAIFAGAHHAQSESKMSAIDLASWSVMAEIVVGEAAALD